MTKIQCIIIVLFYTLLATASTYGADLDYPVFLREIGKTITFAIFMGLIFLLLFFAVNVIRLRKQKGNKDLRTNAWGLGLSLLLIGVCIIIGLLILS